MEESVSLNEIELNELASHLLDEDEEARYEAARAIARIGRGVIDRTLQWTEDTRPLMRDMACFILGQLSYDPLKTTRDLRYRQGVPTLVRLLADDPEATVRSSAACALGFYTLPSTIPALVRAAFDPSPEVRRGVATALGSFNTDDLDQTGPYSTSEVAAALLLLMDDADEDVRDWATFGIHQADLDTPETRARLWKALDDSNPDVRGEAAEGLAKFGDRSLLPILERLLREDTELSPCYFLAAELLGDPSLLPAVLAAAERWPIMEGEELHPYIQSAIESLRKANENEGMSP